ncbi:MAG: hypothetical protein L3K06_01970 [Thermoplasmata archaeon]|nr:hypothetical protein [Thermoplasmata archaeon]
MARRRLVRPHPVHPNRGLTHLAVAPATNAAGVPTTTVSTAAGAGGGGGTLTPAQQRAINAVAGLPTTAGGGVTNAATTAVTGVATAWIRAIAPYLKIAIGGLGLMVGGVTIVFVAGRKTGVGGAVGGAVGVVAGGPAGAVVGKAVSKGTARRSPQRAAATSRTPARPDVAHDRERARRARLEGAESLARTRRAKAETARSEARVSRAYATEARRAKGAQVLNRPRTLPRQARPKRTTARVA